MVAAVATCVGIGVGAGVVTIGAGVGDVVTLTVGVRPKVSLKGRLEALSALFTTPCGMLTFTVPVLLKLPLRLNWTVWASIHDRLVALAGFTGLRPVPERTKSVTSTVEGLTSLENETVIDFGAAWVEKIAPAAN